MTYLSRRQLVFAAWAVLATPTLASAEPMSLRYSATWGGGHAADIDLRLDENGPAFHNRVDIRTVGLARWLSGFKAEAVSAGESGSATAPTAFNAVYESRKKRDKRIDIQFIRLPDGSLAEDGPADSKEDPPIAQEFRRDVIDPLSTLTAIRNLVRSKALSAGKPFGFAVYDGRRRFDVEGAVESSAKIRWVGRPVDVVNLRLLLRPVAGFGGQDEDGYSPDVNTREIQVSFTDDARAIPLRMAVPIAYVPAVIVLNHDTKL